MRLESETAENDSSECDGAHSTLHTATSVFNVPKFNVFKFVHKKII